MKSFKMRRMIGVGLGAGLAIASVYTFTAHSSPDFFQPSEGEFRSLAEFETSPQLQPPEMLSLHGSKEPVPIAQASPDVSLQTNELPPEVALVQLELDNPTSSDWELASDTREIDDWSAVGFSEDDEVEPQQKFNVDDSDPGDSANEMLAWSANDDLCEAESTAGTTMGTDENGKSATSFEVIGPSWQQNPFLGGGTADIVDAKHGFVPVLEIQTSGKNLKRSDQPSSVLESEIGNQLESDQPFASPMSAVESPLSSLDDLVDQPIKFKTSQSSTGDVDFANEGRNTSTALPLRDPYSVAPLDQPLTEPVAQRAVQHIEYGKTLARRGACFAARQEFYSALRVIAQAQDARLGIDEFTLALRRGIMSLKEAEDFMVRDTETEIGLNVVQVVDTHRSKVLTLEEAAQLTPLEAMQQYFVVAQEQFVQAVGRSVVSAEALYCLGKLHSMDAQTDPTAARMDTAKAIVYHRAALASDEKNYRSANELGVLMARSGQLNEARDLFKKSLQVNPAPQPWENLAKVHQRLNEPEMAQLAQFEYQRSLQMAAKGDIQWMPNQQFNAEAPLEFHEAVAAKPATVESASGRKDSAEKSAGNEKSKPLSKLFKDMF